MLSILESKIPKAMIPLVKNSMWLLFDKFIRLFFGLIISTWIARYLGPTEYGVLAYVLAYLAFFQAIATLGMDGIVVRNIARDGSLTDSILGTVFISRLLLGILLWIMAVIGIYIQYGFTDRYLLITAISGGILLFQCSDTYDLWFQSKSKSKYTVKAKLISYIIVNCIKVGFLLTASSLVYFAFAVLMEYIISAIALAFIYHRQAVNHKLLFSSKMFNCMIKESWPFIISNISIIIYMRIDQVFINKYLGSAAGGLYAAILPLVNLWSFIPVIISTSLAPYISKLKIENSVAYKDALSRIFVGYAILGWAVCIPISLLSAYIVPFIFGSAYQDSWSILAILIFTNLFINMGLAQSVWILNEGKSKLSLYKTVFGAIVCIIFNITLIPHYGVNGAAIAAVVAQLSSAILANIVLAPEIFKIQIKSLFFIKQGSS